MNEYKTEPGDDQVYEEREAVAIFPNESSLNNAIDELMQAGLRRDSLSLMADAKFVPGRTAKTENVKETENKDFVEHADYVSPDFGGDRRAGIGPDDRARRRQWSGGRRRRVGLGPRLRTASCLACAGADCQGRFAALGSHAG